MLTALDQDHSAMESLVQFYLGDATAQIGINISLLGQTGLLT